MIAGVSSIRGDTDVAPQTVRHLLAQGVSSVWIAAGDQAAWDALRDIDGVQLFDARYDPFHYQQDWVDRLAMAAVARGAEWIVPFDADEFWFGADGRTVADVLTGLPDRVGKAYATLWHHHTWSEKVTPAERLPKVAYRWTPHTRISPGNHDIWYDPSPASIGETAQGFPLEVRHLQYRSFDQFCEKVADRNRTLAPEHRERGDGVHITRLEHATRGELERAWEDLCARPTVHDPIAA